MSFLGGIVSAVEKVVTDPGALVKEVVNDVLPKDLAVVGDAAGGLVDYLAGNEVQAAQYGLEALGDLPQAVSILEEGSASTGAGGSAASEPTPPASSMPPGDAAAIGGSSAAERALLDWLHKPGRSGASPGSLSVPAVASDSPPPSHSPPASDLAALETTSPVAASGAAEGSAPPPGSLSGVLGLDDDQFLQAVTNGKIPPDVASSPTAMMQIQARVNQITQMNQLLTQMMQARHQMQMAIIQNVRV